MIGDWVYDTILQGYTRVKVLTARGIQGDIHDNIWDEETFTPIPITDEILEENGFKPQGTGWILEDSIGERIFNLCRISNAYCLLTAGMTLAFQYVHELQHLFRLARIKGEIKL